MEDRLVKALAGTERAAPGVQQDAALLELDACIGREPLVGECTLFSNAAHAERLFGLLKRISSDGASSLCAKEYARALVAHALDARLLPAEQRVLRNELQLLGVDALDMRRRVVSARWRLLREELPMAARAQVIDAAQAIIALAAAEAGVRECATFLQCARETGMLDALEEALSQVAQGTSDASVAVVAALCDACDGALMLALRPAVISGLCSAHDGLRAFVCLCHVGEAAIAARTQPCTCASVSGSWLGSANGSAPCALGTPPLAFSDAELASARKDIVSVSAESAPYVEAAIRHVYLNREFHA